MADDIDPNAIPFVPDTSVALIDPASGKPKTAFHDWMQSLYDWMKRSVVDLTTKVTTLISATDGNTAEIQEIAQALTDGTGAYGSYITTIEVKSNQATAGGEVGFYAAAGPAGAVAAYDIALNAGASLAGMQIIAWSGGASSIGFYADQFLFVDSGTAVPVWTYSGGKFTFTGEVAINGSLVINGTVSEDQLALYSATRRSSAFWTGTYESQGWYTHYFTATAGSTVMVMAASSSGGTSPTVFFRALGFTDEVEVPVNESALIVRAYVISVDGTHNVDIMSRGTTFIETADLFVNVIVIQR